MKNVRSLIGRFQEFNGWTVDKSKVSMNINKYITWLILYCLSTYFF